MNRAAGAGEIQSMNLPSLRHRHAIISQQVRVDEMPQPSSVRRLRVEVDSFFLLALYMWLATYFVNEQPLSG